MATDQVERSPFTNRTGAYETMAQPGHCSSCGTPLAQNVTVWHDEELSTYTCTSVCALALSNELKEDADRISKPH